MSHESKALYMRIATTKPEDEDIELRSDDYDGFGRSTHHNRFALRSICKETIPSARTLAIVLLVLFLGLVSILGYGSLSSQLMKSSPGSLASDEVDGLEYVLGPIQNHEEGFTLVSPTYKRTSLLPQYLEAYATGNIPSLRKIILIWNNIDERPPADLVELASSYSVPVIIEERGRNSLNERFYPTPAIKTECVFAMDDDMVFTAKDVENGYQAWRTFGLGRKRMVGFVPRDASDDGVYNPPSYHKYSMLLTKASFFHVNWMAAYWSDVAPMPEFRQFIDEHQNCEDILMAFLQSKFTHVAGLHVESHYNDKGSGGISAAGGHNDHRTVCVRKFKAAFGNDTLVPSRWVLNRIS